VVSSGRQQSPASHQPFHTLKSQRTVNVSHRPDFFLGEMLVGIPVFLEQVKDSLGRFDLFEAGFRVVDHRLGLSHLILLGL